KALGLKITNHLMPVLLGPQGKGKSTFVLDFLTRPVSELCASTDFSEIQDGRTAELWKHLVLFLDEMGHAAKADIDVIKNRITSPTITYRPMGTNRVVNA